MYLNKSNIVVAIDISSLAMGMCVLVYVAFRFNICIESYNFLMAAIFCWLICI